WCCSLHQACRVCVSHLADGFCVHICADACVGCVVSHCGCTGCASDRKFIQSWLLVLLALVFACHISPAAFVYSYVLTLVLAVSLCIVVALGVSQIVSTPSP